VHNNRAGQECAKQNLIATCTFLITDKKSKDFRNALLRQWCCICLAVSWQGDYVEARWEAVRNNTPQVLIELVADPVAEVRAAAVFALATFVGCRCSAGCLSPSGTTNGADQVAAALEQAALKLDADIVSSLLTRCVSSDIVYIVRQELIVALFNYVNKCQMNANASSSSYSSSSPVQFQFESSSNFNNGNNNCSKYVAKSFTESNHLSNGALVKLI